jgi:hypothetical protein
VARPHTPLLTPLALLALGAAPRAHVHYCPAFASSAAHLSEPEPLPDSLPEPEPDSSSLPDSSSSSSSEAAEAWVCECGGEE